MGATGCSRRLREHAVDLFEFKCRQAYDADLAECDKEAAPSATVRKERTFSKRVLYLCFRVGSALIVCVPERGSVRKSRNSSHQSHVGPSPPDIHGILCGRQGRVSKEFRFVRIIFFVCGRLVMNMAVIVVVLGSLWVAVFDRSSTRGTFSFLHDGLLVVRVAATFSAARTSPILKIMPAAQARLTGFVLGQPKGSSLLRYYIACGKGVCETSC
jgi:hypothetical protein